MKLSLFREVLLSNRRFTDPWRSCHRLRI